MKKLIVAGFITCIFQTTLASDYSSYINELGGLGSGVSNNIKQPENYTPRYTDNPPMAEQYYGGGLSLPTQYGESKIAGCKNNVADSDLYLRQECEGVNLIVNNQTKKPDVTVAANEKLVQGTQSIAGDPADTLEKYRWKYPVNADGSIGSIPSSACPTETIQVPAVVTTKTCNEYTGAELFLCEAALKVTVDPNWNYSCLETKYQNEHYECGKKLTVVCETEPDCTAAGVEAESLQGDMSLEQTHLGGGLYNMRFGTARTHVWREDGTYDRSFTMNVKHLDRVSTFKLVKVDWDDWSLIKVNGQVVWSTSSVRGEGEFAGKHVDGERKLLRNFWAPPFAIVVLPGTNIRVGRVHQYDRRQRDVNIDLRPYLREGHNEIFTRTMVEYGGNIQIELHVQSYCEPVCHERWENGCTEYEKRVSR